MLSATAAKDEISIQRASTQTNHTAHNTPLAARRAASPGTPGTCITGMMQRWVVHHAPSAPFHTSAPPAAHKAASGLHP